MQVEHEPELVCVGVGTFDAIALVNGLPHADQRVVADDVRFAGGGPAATAAVAASRLGLRTAFVGAVGDDEDGERILDGLVAEGVDVSGTSVVPGRESGVSVIVVDGLGGTRIICTRPVPALLLTAGSRAAQLLESAPWIHVDHLGWPAVTDLLGPPGAWSGRRLSVDGGNEIPGFSAAGVDLYVPTVEALARRYPAATADESLLDAAIEEGALTVVATRGRDGSVAATAAGSRCTAPAYTAADIHSTLGAGDVFHGALLAALVADLPLEQALHSANTVAALSCRGLDGRSTIPRRHELEALLRPARPLTTTGGTP